MSTKTRGIRGYGERIPRSHRTNGVYSERNRLASGRVAFISGDVNVDFRKIPNLVVLDTRKVVFRVHQDIKSAEMNVSDLELFKK